MPLLLAALLAATLAGTSAPVAAQPTGWHHEDTERVGRIADLDGRLRLQRASGEILELGDGPRARQLAVREGDRLQTSWNSRLVIEVGPNRLKLDEKSTLRVRRFDLDGVELDLERGGVVLDLRRGDSAWRWQVDTAAGRHQPHGAGQFRVEAPDRHGLDTGSATAWRSALRIENEDGTLLLPPGRRAERDRSGRWQIGFPQADAFSGWAMANRDHDDTPDDWTDRRPRHGHGHGQTSPSWDTQPPQPPPRVIVVPAPIVVEPPPRHWRSPMPEQRDPRAQQPPRPDRRHHETAPALPATPADAASAPRRSQRML